MGLLLVKHSSGGVDHHLVMDIITSSSSSSHSSSMGMEEGRLVGAGGHQGVVVGRGVITKVEGMVVVNRGSRRSSIRHHRTVVGEMEVMVEVMRRSLLLGLWIMKGMMEGNMREMGTLMGWKKVLRTLRLAQVGIRLGMMWRSTMSQRWMWMRWRRWKRCEIVVAGMLGMLEIMACVQSCYRGMMASLRPRVWSRL